MSQQLESALVVLVPESEALVKPLRERCDPSAALGVPAHITILYPFKPPDEVSPDVTSALEGLFGMFFPFAFSLTELRTFPDVLYLAPEPSEPFVALIKAVSALFPETPPYRGDFTDIIPHLTVAHYEDDEQLTCLTSEIESAIRSRPPVQAIVSEVTLMDNAHGLWQVRAVFHLGDGSR
jgi:2'-5' RNA ligase